MIIIYSQSSSHTWSWSPALLSSPKENKRQEETSDPSGNIARGFISQSWRRVVVQREEGLAVCLRTYLAKGHTDDEKKLAYQPNHDLVKG